MSQPNAIGSVTPTLCDRDHLCGSSDAPILLIDYQVGTMAFSLTDIDAVNFENNTLWLAIKPLRFRKPSTNKTENTSITSHNPFADWGSEWHKQRLDLEQTFKVFTLRFGLIDRRPTLLLV